MVNWCPQRRELAIEVSEGYRSAEAIGVEQKVMRQWCLRVSAYAQHLRRSRHDRLERLKETQRNLDRSQHEGRRTLPLSQSGSGR